jgi:hypothetical protein
VEGIQKQQVHQNDRDGLAMVQLHDVILQFLMIDKSALRRLTPPPEGARVHALKSPFETEGLQVFDGYALRATARLSSTMGQVRIPLYF